MQGWDGCKGSCDEMGEGKSTRAKPLPGSVPRDEITGKGGQNSPAPCAGASSVQWDAVHPTHGPAGLVSARAAAEGPP